MALTTASPKDAVYALEVYAPASVDPDELTILTPPPGAEHSDPFRVSTAVLAGYKPYLFMPSGRKGRVDPKEGKVDVGAMNFVIGDPRIDGLFDQLKRWLGAYLGDDLGVDAILKCKVIAYESLDGAGSFQTLATCRVEDLTLRDDRLSFNMATKDVVEELINADIFVDTPNASISSYVSRAPIMPVSLTQDWGDFTGEPLRRGIVRTPVGLWPRYVYAPLTSSAYVYQAVIVKQLIDAANKTTLDIVGATQGAKEVAGFAFRIYMYFPTERIKVSMAGGFFWLRFASAVYSAEKHWSLDFFGVDTIDPAEGGVAFPGVGTNVDFAFYPLGDPSKTSPWLINDVAIGTLLKDIALGKFGLYRDGVPLTAVAVDEASFDVIAGDPTFPLIRGYAEKREKRKDYMERICKAHQLALVPQPDGRLKLVDMRPTYGWADDNSVIEDVDIAAGKGRGGWKTSAADAITVIKGLYYRDSQPKIADLLKDTNEFPDPQGARIETHEQPVLRVNFTPRALDFGFKPFDMDFSGLRLSDAGRTAKPRDGTVVPRQAQVAIENTVNKLVDEKMAAYKTGTRYLPLVVRRNAKTEALQIGDRVRVQVSDVPDPLTKVRGGPRAMIVVENEPVKAVRNLVLWDIGAYTMADPPELTNLTLVTGSETTCVQVELALNALNEPAVVEYALTETDETVRPTDGWTYVGTYREALLTATGGIVTICGLPSNTRVWVRARTDPLRGDGAWKLPSLWVYATPDEFVDTDAYTAPSGLVVSEIAGGSARITWANGMPAFPTNVYLKVGTFASLGPEDFLRQVAPGTTTTLLDSLTAATNYTVGVAHPDPLGGLTTIVVANFTTLGAGARLQCPIPAGFDFYNVVPGQVLKLWAADQAFDFKIQRAIDNGANAPNLGLIEVLTDSLPGSTRLYVDPVPGDGTKWWYRICHTRPGYIDSDFLPWKSKVATDDPAFDLSQYPPPQPVMPTWAIATTNTGTLGTMTVTLTDPESRVKRVEFQTQEQGDPPSAWTLDATVPYQATVPVTDSETAVIRVRFIGNDFNGIGNQTLGQEERTFPGRNAGLGPNYVFHTADDASYPNARVWIDSTEISLDATVARQLKAWLVTVPTTKLRAPAGSTPGDVLTVDADGTSIIVAPVSGTDPGIGSGTPGNMSLPIYQGLSLVIPAANLTSGIVEHPEHKVDSRKFHNWLNVSAVRLQAVIIQAVTGGKLALQVSTNGGGVWQWPNAAGSGPYVATDAVGYPIPGAFFTVDAGLQVNNIMWRLVTVMPGGVVVPLEHGVVWLDMVSSDSPPPTEVPTDPDLPDDVTWGSPVLDLLANTIGDSLANGARAFPWEDLSASNWDVTLLPSGPGSVRAGGEYHVSGFDGGAYPYVQIKPSDYGWRCGDSTGFSGNTTYYYLLDDITGEGTGNNAGDEAGNLSASDVGGGGNHWLRIQGDGKLVLVWASSIFGTTVATGTINVADGNRHLVRLTHTNAAGNAQVYVDGVVDINSSAGAVGVNAWSGYMYFGAGTDQVRHINVKVQQIVRYDKAHNGAGTNVPETAILARAGI